MNARYLAPLFLSLACACGDSGTLPDKGEEENPLTDGKSDSFFKPTSHGDLRFGTLNDAEIVEDELFHAWTFTLSGDAEVDLRTEVSANLDTVMYLYRRDPGAENWGRFVRKNDDDDGAISSRITHEADAGEYRVIVKGYKAALRGSFSLVADCYGDGCETPVVDNECRADAYESLPALTPYTESCAFEIHSVLNSLIKSSARTSIPLQNKCELGGLERIAIDYYHQWWDDIAGFDSIFGEQDELVVDIETTAHRYGTVNTVNAGGDEESMTFVFAGEDDRLLASYQHNQSPTLDFYCGQNSESPIEGPSEGCFSDVMNGMVRDEESDRLSNTVLIETAGEVHPALGVAGRRHAENFELFLDAEISYDLVTWRTPQNEAGAEVTIAVEDASITYHVVDTYFDGWTVRVESDPNGARFVCD